MKILTLLFGIFRKSGLVSSIKEGKSLTGYFIWALLFTIIGSLLYGFSMGIGVGLDTAVKDAIKVAIIGGCGLLFSIPIFWISFRLLGRREPSMHVLVVPLTLMVTVAIILAVTSPIVFFLSILAGFSYDAIYIHVVIVDLAMLVGLYLAGTLILHSFTEKKGIVVPNAVGFILMLVIFVVLILFFSPFLSPSPTFSVGTDLLMDRLGIGVAEKAERALTGMRSTDRLRYRYQTTNDNGDITRDYNVIHVGDDFLVEVTMHSLPGEPMRTDGHIWFLDGRFYTDFEGRVASVAQDDLASYLSSANHLAIFTLPEEFATAGWRAFEALGRYRAVATSASRKQASAVLDKSTGRLISLTIGSAEQSLRAAVNVNEISPANLNKSSLRDSLNRAIVLGNVDRSDATMQDFIQADTYFVARYPRTWRREGWMPELRRVIFFADYGDRADVPGLDVRVYDLEKQKNPIQYAKDFGERLKLQPQYRNIVSGDTLIADQEVGTVEYLYDRSVKGEIETTRHIEYIFKGQAYRYHLNFFAPIRQFEDNVDLFELMATEFTFLKSSALTAE